LNLLSKQAWAFTLGPGLIQQKIQESLTQYTCMLRVVGVNFSRSQQLQGFVDFG